MRKNKNYQLNVNKLMKKNRNTEQEKRYQEMLKNQDSRFLVSKEVAGIYVGKYYFKDHPIAKILVGDYCYLTAWLIPFLILYSVPWDSLYAIPWYQDYIGWISGFFSVLNNIWDSDIAFKKYGIAYLAFINPVGLFFCVVYFLLGFQVVAEENSKAMRVYVDNFWKFLFGLLTLLVGTLYMTVMWDGVMPKRSPQIIIEYKAAFIIGGILLWWGIVLIRLFLSITLKLMYLNKFKTHGDRNV
jgi:hypothetical protein